MKQKVSQSLTLLEYTFFRRWDKHLARLHMRVSQETVLRITPALSSCRVSRERVLWIRPSSMAPHSSTLAWKIPWMEEPGGLQSMGSLRVRHDWATSLSLFTFMHWRRKWQPTPVFLPAESQGRGSLVGCRLWVAESRTRLNDLAAAAASLWRVSWETMLWVIPSSSLFRNMTAQNGGKNGATEEQFCNCWK